MPRTGMILRPVVIRQSSKVQRTPHEVDSFEIFRISASVGSIQMASTEAGVDPPYGV